MNKRCFGGLLTLCTLILILSFGCMSSDDGDDADGDDTNECTVIKKKCGDVVSGSTSDLTDSTLDNYSGVSWDESGPEIIYEVPQNDAEPVIVKIEEISADFEADYFILRKCDEAASLLAYGDKEASMCLDPAVYYLVVDGRNGAKGNFEARISCTYCDDPDGDDPDGDDPDGDDPDGDDPDGDDPDGDDPDGDDPDGDDPDGDDPDGDDPDGDDPSTCGCFCESSNNCSGTPPGTTFSSEGCDGWDDDTQCSGWFSVYCASICGDDNNCFMDCEDNVHGNTPPSFTDGSSFTGYGCTITIHCP